MNNSSVLILFSLIMLACSQKSVEYYQLNGRVEGVSNKQIILERIGTKGVIQIDTAMIDGSGNFQMRGVVEEAAFCRLFIDQRHAWPLVIENKEITGTFNYETLLSQIEGSKNSQLFNALLANQRKVFQQIKLMSQELMKVKRSNNLEAAQRIESAIQSISKTNVDFVKKYADTSSTIVRLFAYNLLDFEKEIEYVEAALSDLKNQYERHYYYQDLCNRLEKIKYLSLGSVAPDIALNNPNGELVKLSNLKGKIVLIDFWASWCAPCRKENPHIVKLYNQYKSKGFEVFSVSLDKESSRWLQAIEADKLAWPNHVSDLNGWKSAAAVKYSINSIPTTFLLDREGRIIAKNLRGKQLDNKLKSLF